MNRRARDEASGTVCAGAPRGDQSLDINLPFQMRFDGWIDTDEMDKETLAATIRGEGIDILVDAAGSGWRPKAENVPSRETDTITFPMTFRDRPLVRFWD